MTRRDAVWSVGFVALCIAALAYLTMRPRNSVDRAGADAVWSREGGPMRVILTAAEHAETERALAAYAANEKHETEHEPLYAGDSVLNDLPTPKGKTTRYAVADLPVKHMLRHGGCIDIGAQNKLQGVGAIDITEVGQTIFMQYVLTVLGQEATIPITLDHNQPVHGQSITLR